MTRQPVSASRSRAPLRFAVALLCAALAGVALLANPTAAFAKPAAAAPPAPEPAKAPIEMNLAVGQAETIKLGEVAQWHPGIPGIVDVKFNGDQVVFTGIKPGSSSVVFFLARGGVEVDYMVNVFNRDVDAVRQELEKLLEGYTGVRVRKVGARFFLEGGVSTDGDARRINQIASLYGGQVESLVVVGSVGAEHNINVRVDFYFVQYDHSSSYGVGLSYPSQFLGNGSYQFQVANPFTQTSGTTAGAVVQSGLTFTQQLPALDLAETHGWAKVLKHSTVVTTSGSEAIFKSGGEQNFTVATAQATGIHAIPYGTNVTILPRYDPRSRDLEVKVGADVADLTPPEGATTLPGRKMSTIQTFVHLKLGESIVLSGIRSSSQTHSVAGIPGLDYIPVLGLLFSSSTNSITETEGAIFIIPSVVESVPKRSFDMVEEAMKEFEDYSGDIETVKSYTHAPPSYTK